MKYIVLSFSFLAFLLAFAFPADAQELRYLGKLSGQESGWIQISGKDYEVSEGTLIPGWGTVKQITEAHLVIDKALSEGEKEGLRIQGGAVYDVLQIFVPHKALRVVPAP
jgi:UDP-glucose 4-epimerase